MNGQRPSRWIAVSALAFACVIGACSRKHYRDVYGPVVTADPTPSQLDLRPLPPSSGPLLEMDACGDEFRAALDSLGRHESIKGDKAGLFRRGAPLCKEALSKLTTALQDPAVSGTCETLRDAARTDQATMNDCLVAAAADPRVGEEKVQAALGNGFVPHSVTCTAENVTEYERVKETLATTGTKESLLILVPQEDHKACAKVFQDLDTRLAAMRGTPAHSCIVDERLGYDVDRCLLLAARNDAGGTLVDALAGRGAFATSLKSPAVGQPSGQAKSCGLLFDRLPKTPRKKPKKREAAGQAESARRDSEAGAALAAPAPTAAEPEEADDDEEEEDGGIEEQPVGGGTTEDILKVLGQTNTLQKACKATAAKYGTAGTCPNSQAIDARILDVCSAAANPDTGWSFLYPVVNSYDYQFYRSYDYALSTYGRYTSTEFHLSADGFGATAAPARFESKEVLTGLADFVATRARKEILDFLAREFGGRICNTNMRGIAVSSYFSETCHLLQADGGEVETISEFGSSLQRAIEHDLGDLLPALLNAATDKIVKGPKWLKTMLSVVEKVALGDAPDTLIDTIFEAAACPKERKKSADDWACALHAVGIVWAHQPTTSDAEKLLAALNKDVAAKWWISDRGIDVKRIESLVTVVTTTKKALDTQKGSLRASAVVKGVREVLDILLPTETERTRRLLSRVEAGLEQWGDLGYLVYHGAQALMRGESLAGTAIAASAHVDCRYHEGESGTGAAATDLGCGLRLFGLIVDVLSATRAEWNRLPEEIDLTSEDVRTYITDVQERLERHLHRKGNEALDAWVTLRFGSVIGVRIADGAKRDIRVLLVRILAPLRRAETLVQALPETEMADPEALFAAAVNVLRALLVEVISDETRQARALQLVDDAVEAITAIQKREIPALGAALYALAVDLGVPDPLPKSVAKYLPLVTALAGAQDADQVARAFEKYADPPDSYRRKRNAGSHISLTALLGVGGGIEVGEDVPAAGTAAIVTPIGVDVTWGSCRACGLMVSLLDIGALTESRFTGDEKSLGAEDPSWEQVVSPGAFFRVAIGGPFVFAVGASLAPNLRKEGTEDRMVARFFASASVDVTIFGLR